MNKAIVHHRAAKYLRKLPVPEKEGIKKFLKKLEQLALDYPGIKKWLANGPDITESA